ncbi:MAG: hypothetical protein ACYTGN_10895 [Planctomycetota bacterium]|jgi:hypothetical protein
MTAKLTISFSDDILHALKASKSITIKLDSKGGRPAASGSEEPRAGSLPARTIDWAKGRSKPFGTQDVVKRFKLSRAHASMLLSRLANGPYPIDRQRRGVYEYAGK